MSDSSSPDTPVSNGDMLASPAAPAAPAQPVEPAPPVSLPDASVAFSNMAMSRPADYVDASRRAFRMAQEQRFEGLALTDYDRNISNDAFIPLQNARDPQLRMAGIAAFFTQDLLPESKKACQEIFGNTRAATNDKEAYMLTGRALCSAYGFNGNPAGFLQVNGKKLGLSVSPSAQNETDFYTMIGQQFALMTRKGVQDAVAQQKAAMAARIEENRMLVEDSISRLQNGEALTARHQEAFVETGIDPNSVKRFLAVKDKYLYEISHITIPTGGLQSVKMEKRAKYEFRDSPELLDSLADDLEGDNQARRLFINWYVGEKYKRLKEQGQGSSIKTAISEIMDNTLSSADNIFWGVLGKFGIGSDNQRAFRAEIESAYTLAKERATAPGFWENLPAKSISSLASLAPWLNPYTAGAKIADIYVNSSQETLSRIYNNGGSIFDLYNENLNPNFEASWWERQATPALEAGITVGAMKLAGAGAKWAKVLFNKAMPGMSSKIISAMGAKSANAAWYKIAGSRALGWGLHSAESLATLSVALPALEMAGHAAADQILPDRQATAAERWEGVKTSFTNPEYWAEQIVAAAIFGAMGFKGARSALQFEGSLGRLGFSRKEVEDCLAAGAPKQVQKAIADTIAKKLITDPEGQYERMQKEGIAVVSKMEMASIAESGVRDELLKESGISSMERDGDGKFTVKVTDKDAEGKPVTKSFRWSEDQLNAYLASQAENEIVRRMRDTQKLLRGEQAAATASRLASEGKSPFAKVAFLSDLPPEVLAHVRQKGVIDKEALRLMSEYAVREIQAKLDAGMPEAEAAAAEFGSTGAPLSAVRSLASEFAKRENIARSAGELAREDVAETASLILPGRSAGDSILLLARGEVTASEVAHDWVEAIGRARLSSGGEQFKDMLDHLDSQLPEGQSLFGGKSKAEREDIDYIEAYSRLMQADSLLSRRSERLDDISHDVLDFALDDLSSVQSNIALAKFLADYAKGGSPDAVTKQIKEVLDEGGVALHDFYREMQKASEQEALKAVKDYEREQEQRLKELEERALKEESEEFDRAEALEKQEQEPTPAEDNITGVELPAEASRDPYPVDKETGELSQPPMTSPAPAVKDPVAGRGLVKSTVFKMEDGSVIGSIKPSSLSFDFALANDLTGKKPDARRINRLAKIAAQHSDPNEPALVLRFKNGKMQLISGLGHIARAKEGKQPCIPVRVVDFGGQFTRAWARNEARAASIKDHTASSAEILDHIRHNRLTREKAYEKGLVPRDADGKETAASRLAWQRAEKAVRKYEQEGQAASRTEADPSLPSSFSIRAGRRRDYTPLEEFVKEDLMARMLDYAKRQIDEFRSLAHLDDSAPADAGRMTAARARGIYNAILATIPKEARPWRELREAQQIEVWAKAILDTSVPIERSNAIDESDRFSYMQATPAERYAMANSRLLRLSEELITSTARTLERHLIRKLMEKGDRASRIFTPKQNANRRDQRGKTSAEANKKAALYRDMWEWTNDRVEEEMTAHQALLDKAIADHDPVAKDKESSYLAAVTIYGGLRNQRNLADVRRGVECYLDFVRKERNLWDIKLEDEAARVRKWQKDLADARPEIPVSALHQLRELESGHLGRSLKNLPKGLMNIIQSLDSYSERPGLKVLSEFSKDLCMQLDQNVKYRQQARLHWEQAFERQFDITGNAFTRDKKRSQLINKFKETHNVTDRNNNIVRKEGEIKTDKWNFDKAEWERLVKMTPEQREKEEQRIREEYEREGKEPKPYPSEAAIKAAKDHMADENYKGGRFTISIKRPRDKEHESDLKMTRFQALNLYLIWNQPTYREMLADKGYTESVMRGVRDYIGEDLISMGRWMREYIDNTGMKEVYETRMGLPFPAEENYWPSNFDALASPKGETTLAFTNGGAYQMLIRRVKHDYDPNTTIDAVRVFFHTLEQHYTYITSGRTLSDWRRYTLDRDTAARLVLSMGDSSYKTLRELFAMVENGNSPIAAAEKAVSNCFARTLGARAVAVLSGTITTFSKQFTGIFHGHNLSGISFPKYLGELLLSGIGMGHKTVRDILNLDSFKIRSLRQNLTAEALSANSDQKITNWRIAKVIGMGMHEKGDIMANALAMTALYNARYKAIEKSITSDPGHARTLSPAEIRQVEAACEEYVSRALHKNAQPLQEFDKSAIAATTKSAFVRGFTYMGSETINKIGLAVSEAEKILANGHTPRDYAKAALKMWRVILPYSISTQLINMAWSLYNGTAPDIDDEDFTAWLAWNLVYGASGVSELQYLPGVGFTIGEGANYLIGKKGPTTYTNQGIGFNIADYRALANMLKMDGEDTPGETAYNAINALRTIDTATGMAGTHNKTLSGIHDIIHALNTIANFARPGIQRWKNTGE